MQRDIREKHLSKLSEVDRKKFVSAAEEGKLLKPELPGNVIARLALDATEELTGKLLRWASLHHY